MSGQRPVVIGSGQWHRVPEPLLRAALCATVAGFALLSFAGRFGRPESPAGYALAAVMATVSAVVVWSAPRYRWPLFAVAVISWPVLCVAGYVAATTCTRRRQLLFFTAAASLVVVLPSTVGAAIGAPGYSWAGVVSASGGILLFVALPVLLGLWTNARREVVAGLRERTEHLRREQEARTEQARVQERARIAREMHDIVAHRVSLMVLQAGALQVNAPDDSVAVGAAQIRSTGREALVQLREVLGVLRGPERGGPQTDPQPSLADLDPLLGRSRGAGLPVERRDEGPVRPLPESVQRTAYRVVQEALTNVHRHAGAVATEVVLRYEPAALSVTVRNAAPRRSTEGLPGSGFGLVGLRERTRLLGGALTTRADSDGGYTLTAVLPTAPAAAPAAGCDSEPADQEGEHP